MESIPEDGELSTLRALRTVVLCGGPGVERAVSLESGRNVATALAGDGFRVTLADVRDADGVRALSGDLFLSMLHGEFGEDGGVQTVLEEMGAAYAGSGPAASALALDKYEAKRRFDAEGIPTPRAWRAVAGTRVDAQAMRAAGLAEGGPWVVKPNARGSSVGVAVVREVAGLSAALAAAWSVDDVAMVEDYVAGRELTVGVWTPPGAAVPTALPVIELIPDGKFYDYRAKYQSDNTRYRCPAEVDAATTAAVRGLGVRVFQALGLRDLARVDVLLDGAGRPWVLEANTAPGFTSHSLFPMAAGKAGYSFVEVCAALASLAWRRRTEGTDSE